MTAQPARVLPHEPPPPSPKRRRTLKVWATRLPNIVLWDEIGHSPSENSLMEDDQNVTAD